MKLLPVYTAFLLALISVAPRALAGQVIPVHPNSTPQIAEELMPCPSLGLRFERPVRSHRRNFDTPVPWPGGGVDTPVPWPK